LFELLSSSVTATGGPTLLGVAAILASVSGLVTTVFGLRKSRNDERAKAEAECLERLKVVRKEAEDAAAELHELKMGRRADES
jgi:hypothetical protein